LVVRRRGTAGDLTTGDDDGRPVTLPESDALSKDLKRRGFSFVGTVACYALMQSVGMVDDHVQECFRAASA
jgi:DNA-3-methyladenine glycosylase I